MELRLQPKPEIEIPRANKGIVSKEQFFVKKKIEKINQYFFPAHLIRNWRPKAELLYPPISDETAIQYECDFNRDIQNCFVEDYAEEVFLRTPPACFVVIGKCGPNVRKLSQEISKEYGSVLIQVDDVVGQVLKTESETSKLLTRILRLGVSLTLNFVLALLSYVAHTAEARHRGYVLCGLPSTPHLYDLSVEQQFNYLFTWDNKPTVFIHVLYEDEDLVNERTNTRCRIDDAGNEKCILTHFPYEEAPANESEGEEEQDELLPVVERTEGYERDINISPSRPWVQLPRDEESQVWSELELFDVQIKPMIELIISRVDPQYFITVDSRVNNEFEVVQARLQLLRIWKSPVAVPFIPLREIRESSDVGREEEPGETDTEGTEADFEIVRAAEEPPESAFLTLFNKKTISPKYRWELSHYNYVCPVSLRAGEVIQGKSEFAVVFMKYIYFLRDKESMVQFIKNPRPYVLPVRPKPLCRFIVVGLPLTGKTTLARHLAQEFSIPIIDVDAVLREDEERKKNIYQEFCRQKAEYREMTRLTAHSWRDWRVEEEQRVNLIEEWVSYVQTLLEKRIKQFYTLDMPDNASIKETQVQSYSPVGSSENFQTEGGSQASRESIPEKRKSGEIAGEKPLEVHGVAIETPDQDQRRNAPADDTTSAKIIQAMKHGDFNFNENGTEVEANLFFSSLWNTFSNERWMHHSFGKPHKNEEDGEGQFESEDDPEDDIVNWCSLLPPQSLSSFLIKKKPVTVREKRKSFKIFLEAASKAYWAPSQLKKEFIKWRLPCFMDIPLCEIYMDNPILLFKYIPEWLKERPQIPDPIDPTHPNVIDAGQQAFLRADIVTVTQNTEEKGTLLANAIEKAEREGMRVTAEVITPGGWVVDNMILDLDVWGILAKRNVFADHVYFLMDSEPESARIIRTWCERNCQEVDAEEKPLTPDEEDLETMSMTTVDEDQALGKNKSGSEVRDSQDENGFRLKNLLLEMLASEEDELLDELYEKLTSFPRTSRQNTPMMEFDVFSHHLLQSTGDNWSRLDDSLNEESDPNKLSQNVLFNRHVCYYYENLPLGLKLEVVTSNVLNIFEKAQSKTVKASRDLPEEFGIKFFVLLLTLPRKLEKIKQWLKDKNRGVSVTEIDVLGKTPQKVFSDVREELFEPFIKKPRDLETFEVDEIREEFLKDAARKRKDSKEDVEDADAEPEEEGEEEGEEKREDVRIYGESGPLCIVNLERNILLFGKEEFALRYYGKLYFFYNEEAKNQFIEDPEKYAPYYSPIRCLPPLRIFFVGPIGCGKTTLATPLSNECSLKYEDYIQFLNRKLIPHNSQPYQKLTAITDNKLLLSEDHSKEARAAIEHFMRRPHTERQYLLENPFTYFTMDDRMKAVDNPQEPLNLPEFDYKQIDPFSGELPDGSDSSPGTGSASQEEPFISMEKLGTIIGDYVRNSAKLPSYYAEKCLKELWTKEPHVTKGFLLEGFPLKNYDVQIIKDNKWFPDLVVEIILSEEMVIENNIKALMEQWRIKLNQEITEEKLLEDAVKTIQRYYRNTEKERLLAAKFHELRERSDEDSAKGSASELDKQNSVSSAAIDDEGSREGPVDLSDEVPDPEEIIHQQVEKELTEQFPKLTFNPIFETPDSGRARIIADLVLNYKKDMTEISEIKERLKEVGVPWLEIKGMNNKRQNYLDAILRVDAMKQRLDCKGEFAFEMTLETAETLLRQGFYFLSKFGRWCPVQVYRLKNSIHMFRPLSKRGKIIPVAYRNYIYFVGGVNEAKKFREDPLKYTFNEPHHPNVPLRIAVIGPPKSGKSTLSTRLGLMFDLKVVTMGSALRFVLEKMADTVLANSINSYLRRGCFLPLSLKIEALLACLNDPVCATQGFVFDGIPFDAALTQSLAEQTKLPFVIISLVADAYFGKTNRQGLDVKEFRLEYKNRVNLDSRYREWEDTYKKFLQWNQESYNNVYEVNARSSILDIFYRAYDIIRKSFFAILHYVEYCVSEKALPLEYLCVSQHEYELRKSLFHNNCPVCWLESNRLNSSSDPPPRSGLVQYLNHFYWVCPGHMDDFVKSPKTYLPPRCPQFPKLLPKILMRSMFENAHLKIHGHGRCPVTRTDFPARLDWEGSWDFAVSYKDEVYLCRDKAMQDRFLARPWRYSDADTEFEVARLAKSLAVEQLGPPTVTCLPPVGFLEQTVANLIQKSLRVLGAVRPLYPNLSPSCTGCVFVGLYLKVYNRKNKTPHLEKDLLEFMVQYCKAYRYRDIRRAEQKKQEVTEDEFFDDGSSPSLGVDLEVQETRSVQSMESAWLDIDSRLKNKIWSAQRDDANNMILTAEDELLEIPEVPQSIVVLKYQTYSLRTNPLPPLANCITLLYSPKPNLEIPEKFNYNSLYQHEETLSSPYPRPFLINPDKEFGIQLYQETKPEFPSETNLWKLKRTISESTEESAAKQSLDPELEYMIEHFIPRFQLFDSIHNVKVPPVPKAVEKEPIVYNPHRDYAYTMLLAEFFHSTHILLCHEWDDGVHQLEYWNRFDRSLELTNVQVEYFYTPKRAASIAVRPPMRSYQDIFDAASLFLIRPDEVDSETVTADETPGEESATERASLVNFIQTKILEAIDMHVRKSSTYSSFQSYDIVPISERPFITIQEIFPYPPLTWDILSRPYHCYLSLPSIFRIPPLDEIAHERHVSVLDGLRDMNERFRFVRYPMLLDSKSSGPDSKHGNKRRSRMVVEKPRKIHPVYDFFNLPWTSFLPYPFSWAYNRDVRDNFIEIPESGS